MNPLSFISHAYLRWRHSHGFGVHSPFAFNLVTSAIRPGDYGFYGYDLIDDALLSPDAGTHPRLRKDARLLLRLIVALGCRRVFISSPCRRAFFSAAEGAGVKGYPLSGTNASPGPADLVVVEGEGCTPARVEEMLQRGAPVIAIDPPLKLRRQIENGISRGLVFSGTRIMLGVPREEMALVSYSMRF